MLLIKNLSAGYQQHHNIIEDVSLEVRPGEIVGLIGRNGSGKSTFVKAVANLLPCRSGEIFVGGKNITSNKTHELRKDGLVFFMQGGKTFDSLTIKEHYKLLHIDNGYTDDYFKETSLLSGGERNIFALNLCLATSPSVLILDEPLAGLSEKKKKSFSAIFKDIAENKKIAIVLIEHNAKMLEGIAGSIFILNEKKIKKAI